jgi:hypothetical protein
LVQYQYWHIPLPELAFQNGAHTGIGIVAHWFSTGVGTVYYWYWHSKNGARTGTGIFALWFSTGIGTVHYRYWHSKMVPVLVPAFLYFGSLSVLAWVITGNGIQWCPFRFWHFRTLVQYQYGHITLPVLAFNIARTGNGISTLWFSTGIGTFHNWYWHSKMVPIPVLAFLHFGSVPV